MKQENPNLDNLEAFLIDDSLSKKDAVKELRLQGVNTEALFDRVQRIVRDGYSTQLRLAAEQEQASRASAPGFLANLPTMSRDAMRAVFERVASGDFGPEYRTAALARCRNKDASGLTDEELRSWLEDISDMLGEPGK
jgi:hypothetical protein